MMKQSKYIFSLLLIFLIALPLSAQKKILDHSVYDSWKSIPKIIISKDGRYGIGQVSAQEGDGYIQVNDLVSLRKTIINRAYNPLITPDGCYAITLIKAPFQATRQAKIKKIADEKLPKDSLAIISLKHFKTTLIADVKDFKIGKDFTQYVAYKLDDTLSVKNKKELKSYTLIVRNLLSEREDTIRYVSEYTFSKNGQSFAAILHPPAKDSTAKSEVLFIDLNTYDKKDVSEGKTIYKNISLSDSGNNLAFIATSDSLKTEIKSYSLYHYTKGNGSAIKIADRTTPGMPHSWDISENFIPIFSRSGNRLIFGTAPIVQPKDTTIPDFEKAQLDIWHWKDSQIQPMQLVQLEKKQQQAYTAYFDLSNTSQMVQLGSENIPNIQFTDENDGRYAIGTSDLLYKLEQQWDVKARSTTDIYLFDLQTNTSQLILKKLEGKYELSPQGNYIVWYDLNDKHYYAYSFITEKKLCLTDNLSVNFWNEKHDTPSVPNPYGFGPWMENDNAFFVYDAYDIWQLDPSGQVAPSNITKQTGRQQKITFRYIQTDPDSRFVTASDTMMLSAFNNTTKERGFYSLSKNLLNRLIMDKYHYPNIEKAKNKNIFLFTKNNYTTSPDIHVTNNLWKNSTQLSDINPQMREFAWGKMPELVSWNTFDGRPTQGIVYKPANFDPNKKYPVIVYFYEKYSDDLYQYYPPVPSRSVINFSFYTGRGYVIFIPDIQYGTGHPGQDAYNSIVSGAEFLAKNTWIDKDNMAIQGQSWGGYQVAYLITRTNMFKAAEAGAPVSNMFSAYGGIRWQTGMSRQYQYEQTQSRIGATMWESPELYKENSPIFFADRVKTPLLIMHNDKDGAVPWYQGIEYFMALRRLEKPVWLLQYNNEEHNLKERRNSKDLTIRLQQFFDHYLKGEPAPKWMRIGVPAIDKGNDYGLEVE